MNSPVNFFGRDQVSRPPHENAWSHPETKQKINREDYDSIAREQDSYMQRRLAQGNMFGLFGGADVCVVFEMAAAQRTARPMQRPAMISILESIGPYQSDD